MKDDIAIRKRSQIAKANRTMFIWIAIASVLVGVGAVAGFSLFQRLTYTEKVLSEKQKTVATLKSNKVAIDSLEDDVRALDANSDLASIKANQTDQAIQVILDALPSNANTPALGASLQTKLLSGAGQLDSIQLNPVAGVESLTSPDEEATVDASAEGETANEMVFQFKMTGTEADLRKVLENLEKSIRAIVVTSAAMEYSNGVVSMTVEAKVFYTPETTLELKDKVVPR